MAASTTLSPEQRRERGRNAFLTAAVNTVEKRAGELTAEQRSRVLNALNRP